MTSTTLTPGRPTPGWLKHAMVAAGVFALCWGGAIWYWRGAERAPDSVDLALALLVLPWALLSGAWLGRRALGARTAKQGGAGAAPASHVLVKAAAGAPLAFLASSLRSAHGASAEELAASIAAGKARPDLDPELVDDDGFPVMSARCSEAVDPALQEEIEQWLAAQGMAQLRFGDAQWRALTLGTAVTRDLASEAVAALMPAEGPPPPLRLLPVFTAGWTVEQKSAASLWLKHTATQFGWPAGSITWIDAAPAGGEAAPASLLGALAQEAMAPDARIAALIVAFASHIDQDTVDDWAARSTLFTAARPQGMVPGEGAAGLLVTDLRSAHAAAYPFAQLDPMLQARRETSSDEARRADPALLAELTARALNDAALEPGGMALLVADTGQHNKRALELAALAATALPQLDGTDEVLLVGAALGACASVPFLCTLALSAHHVLAHGTPVLCVGNDHPVARCVATVRLPTPPRTTS